MKLAFLIIFISFSFSQTLLDGKFFDTGRTMTSLSKTAPKGLDALLSILGAWDISETIFRNDSAVKTLSGHSEITLHNRGNSFLERSYIYKKFRKTADEYEMTLITKSKSSESWGKGIASAYKENIQLLNGEFKNKKLLFYDANRYQGGQVYTLERQSYSIGKKKFSFLFESSTDHGKSWQKKSERIYTKVSKAHKMFTARSDLGAAASEAVAEAREFDFLLGEGLASHSMTLPTGRNIKFPANATAVHTLNGKGIMEFNTVDVDQSLPDAATTIIRVYNRAMRRWDNLFLNNRANTLYFFGGAKEGSKIVLHNFADHRGLGSMSNFVFYNIQENGDYDWYGETSRDGGKSFFRFWDIEIRKK